MDIDKSISKEKILNAMDMTAMMVIMEVAADMNVPTTDVLIEFMKSKTGQELYDDSLKLWWDGPTCIATAFKKEIGWI